MTGLVVTTDHTLTLEQISEPIPGPYQSLVKILACGICSTTDWELIKGTQPYHNQYPCLLGHEAIGEVIKNGVAVRNFQIGDWVTRPAGILPGTTSNGITSAWGGFAEYGLITDIAAMAADGDHSMDADYTALRQNVLEKGKEIGIEASVLSIALSETHNWIQQLQITGGTVCINGTGIAGLSLTMWAKLAGAEKLIVLGRRNERLQLAAELGADELINIRELSVSEIIQRLHDGGVNVFIEATGIPNQMELAIRSVKPGGKVAVYGVAPNDKYELAWHWLPVEIRIMRHEPQEQLARKDVVDLMITGKIPVNKLMTHQWPLDQFANAFDSIKNGQVVKSMLLIK